MSQLKKIIATSVLLTTFSAPAAFAAIENVGGGAWNHGVKVISVWEKQTYSNYRHSTLRHGSTAYCGQWSNSATAGPGAESQALQGCGLQDGTAAYWRTS